MYKLDSDSVAECDLFTGSHIALRLIEIQFKVNS
jgi:hypothetical protein